MKRFISVLLSVFLVMTSLALFSGCGSVSTANGAERKVIISEEKIDEELRWFLGISGDGDSGNMGNRTYTSDSEYIAAKRLVERFSYVEQDESDGEKEKYKVFSVTPLESTTFDVKITTQATLMNPATQIVRNSQNVVVKFGGGTSGKQIIIGTGYGNDYGSYDTKVEDRDNPENYGKQGSSTGAFASGTGVATVLAIMDYFSEHASEIRAKIDFDVIFVFFGCSEYNSLGASSYADGMKPSERLNTGVMFNISRLGGERAYIYANDYKTDREDFLINKATTGGYEFYGIPKNMPIIEAEYIKGVNYTHYAMLGDHAVFTEWGINSVSIRSGYYGGFNLSDIEHSGEKNIAGTASDTYVNLNKVRKSYARQGSDAASLILSAITSDGFMAAMSAADEDYSFWLEPLWAQLILLGVILLLGVLAVVLVKVFEKKYPYHPKTKKMKIAVFGPEYESKNEDEIIIDVKPPDGRDDNNPFGI